MTVSPSKQPYRLGLDLGSNSIGWSVLRLNSDNEPDYLIRLGVRIFSNGRNPKDGVSLAVNRRTARQQRRRRDRLLRRKKRLLKALRHFGFFPESVENSLELKTLNPYELRARGLKEELKPFEFGRAVFHLNQRRGFKSNRRADRGAEKKQEKTKIGGAVNKLRDTLLTTGAESLGEHLYQRLVAGQGTRARRFGQSTTAEYDFYADRQMVADEFDLLWTRQASYQPTMYTDQARAEIRGIVLFQRPLREVKPGRCSLEPGEWRAPLALPSVQQFRVLQEINNLKVRSTPTQSERSLTDKEREILFTELERKASISFGAVKKRLSLPREAKFNLEGIKRDKLKGNFVSSALAEKSGFGEVWYDKTFEEQDALVVKLLDEKLSDEGLLGQLKNDYRLSEEQASAVMDISLPDGYGKLSSHVIFKLIPHLKAGMSYAHAVGAAGYPDTNTDGDGSLSSLPYYGQVLQRHVAFGSGAETDSIEKRYGKIANPSVHIALNELRKLINALIKRYGKPSEVVLELTRDIKLSWDKAREIEAEQAKQQKANDELRKCLTELGQPHTAGNVLKLRLYNEMSGLDRLARPCVYTGESISLASLFSSEIEVDHILPYHRTLDDSIANKVLCKTKANRLKGNRTPFEAFAHSPNEYDWNAILGRAALLSRGRVRRFAERAMARFEENNGFLARQLNDTAYMSRLAREYVSFICDPNKIWVTTGRLTGHLRHIWGLNGLLSHDHVKNRRDHRHHAIDATVIACIDPSLIQRVARAATRATEQHQQRLLADLDFPWPSFNAALENALERVVISYRPDHSTEGALHNDTAYGAAISDDGDGNKNNLKKVHHYIPILDLKNEKPEKILENVADPFIAKELNNIIIENLGSSAVIQSKIEAYSKLKKIRRVRWRENWAVIPIKSWDKDALPYKYVKGDGNYCYEIFLGEKNKWNGEVISIYRANQSEYQKFKQSNDFCTTSYSGKKLIMRLMINDTLRMLDDAVETIYRVQKFSSGQLTLSQHLVVGDPVRNPIHIPGKTLVKRVAPSKLVDLKARRVFVDILGRVFDPGVPSARTDCRDIGK
jgi:CRISPR-associated endonuclease Csn1